MKLRNDEFGHLHLVVVEGEEEGDKPVGEGGSPHHQTSPLRRQQLPHIRPGDRARPEGEDGDGEHKGPNHHPIHDTARNQPKGTL